MNNEKTSTLFPTTQQSQSLIHVPDTSWLSVGSSFRAPPAKTEDKKKSKKESKDKKRKREKHEKKRKKSKRKKREKEEEDSISEKAKVIAFEKKRIRIDPRSDRSNQLFPTIPTEDEPFIFDRKGDPDNLVFGGLYSGDVPDYVRYGKENPFLEEALIWRRKKKQYISNAIVYEKGKFLRLSDDCDDFIDRAPSNRYWKGKLSRLRKDTGVYRIRPSKRPPQEVGEDFISTETDEQGVEESFEEYVYRRTREFNEMTRKQPNNIRLWLEFVHFQDEFAKLQRKNITAIVEKKIAIYEKALSYNPKSVPLLLGHLRESRKILTPNKIEQGWMKALTRVPDSIILWKEYFLFKKSVFSEFNVTNMREVCAKAMKNFLDLKRKTNDVNYHRRIEHDMLQIFYEACVFERQSGFTERAIALLQAMIELNVFCPHFCTTWSSQIQEFEEFWESEAPRIGEDGAQGWKFWLLGSNPETHLQQTNEDQEDDYDPLNEEDFLDIISDKQVFLDWLKEEEKLSMKDFLPCRPLKDSNVVKLCPDRIVMFDDIKDFLFPITDANVLQELVFLFLEFLGIPIIYTQRSIHDTLVHENLLNKDDPQHLFSIFPKKDKKNDEELFEWKPQSTIYNPNLRKFIKNVCTQCMNAFSGGHLLAMCLLDFEAQKDVQQAKKLAKSFLKEDRENIYLWNYYAQLEKKSGNLEVAKKIYNTVLQTKNEFLLYRCFAELCYKNSDQSLYILSCCGKQEYKPTKTYQVSTTDLIKVRRFFEEQLGNAIEKREFTQNTLELIMCYALFEQLTGNDGAQIFERALKEYKFPNAYNVHCVFTLPESIKQKPISFGDVHEQYLWLLYLRFLKLYQKENVTKLRRVVVRFLERFPSHVVGLALFIESTKSLTYQSRRHFDQLCSNANSPIIYLFAVQSELKREDASNRIRSIFERALENQIGRSNVMLWRMYIRFEVSQGNIQAAKRLFYRAIDKCPHSKVLWMDSFKLFSDDMDVKEIKELCDLIMEKEIMNRISIEHYVASRNDLRMKWYME